ncbi:MAG: hypothetical protein KIT87_05695 [Anaerolineae bacterium]|nr:hypothetical protein [Anaerolineae bacterium]
MGNNLVPGVRGVRRLASLGLSLLLCVVCLGGLTTSPASAASNVSIVRQTMEGNLKIKPGSWVAAGYVFRVKNGHPAMTVRVKQAQVVVNMRCEQSKKLAQIIIPLHADVGYVDYPIAASDDTWRPTKDTNEAYGYQGAGRAPTVLCAEGEMIISDSPAGGVTFTAEVKATSLVNDIEIKFHYRVPEAKGKPNLNCSSQVENPSPGTPPCTGKWSPTQTLRATEGIPTEGADDATVPPQVNGFAFNDLNSDGVFQQGSCSTPIEPAISGVTVNVYDANTNALVGTMLTRSPIGPCDFYAGYYNILLYVPGAGPYCGRDAAGRLHGEYDAQPGVCQCAV